MLGQAVARNGRTLCGLDARRASGIRRRDRRQWCLDGL